MRKKSREAEAVALKERSPFGLKTGSYRALQRPLLSQPDALASGIEILYGSITPHVSRFIQLLV
jgi:hypothetical protein